MKKPNRRPRSPAQVDQWVERVLEQVEIRESLELSDHLPEVTHAATEIVGVLGGRTSPPDKGLNNRVPRGRLRAEYDHNLGLLTIYAATQLLLTVQRSRLESTSWWPFSWLEPLYASGHGKLVNLVGKSVTLESLYTIATRTTSLDAKVPYAEVVESAERQHEVETGAKNDELFQVLVLATEALYTLSQHERQKLRHECFKRIEIIRKLYRALQYISSIGDFDL